MLLHFIALALLGAGPLPSRPLPSGILPPAPHPSASPPLRWPVEQYVRWQPGWGSNTIQASGLHAHVKVEHCGKERPASEACSAGAEYLVVTVGAPGLTPTTLRGDPGEATYIGIGKLTKDALHPALILISDQGGSAACAAIDIVAPDGRGYRSARLGTDKVGVNWLCEIEADRLSWPSDLTHKGRAEFLLNDTIFHCRFTSCAGSWYPPQVIAFVGGRSVDVSADPALAPLYRADMAKARTACERDVDEAQGACAGYAADAARLGLLPQAWRTIDAQVRRGCRIKVLGACPYGNLIPATFPTSLKALLRTAGYSLR